MKVPKLVRRCLSCKRWVNVTVIQKCCGNDLVTTEEYQEINNYMIVRNETELLNKVIPVVRNGKEHTRVVKGSKKPNRRKTNIKLRNAVLERDNRKCTKCGAKEELQVHHIIPRSNGGKDEMGNLVTLCAICHAGEHANEQVYKIMMKRIFNW